MNLQEQKSTVRTAPATRRQQLYTFFKRVSRLAPKPPVSLPGRIRLASLVLLSLSSALLMSSCEEETPFVTGPVLTLDTTYIDTDLPPAQARVVLLEDFTGVQCVNCPDAHNLAKSLIQANPGRVAAVSEHNYFLGGYPNSSEDFRTDEAFAIDALIGPTTLWPIGTVNRRQFSAEPAILLTLPKWTGYVDSELLEEPLVNVSMELDLKRPERLLEVLVEAHFLETVPEATRLSVMVLESGIVDPQLTLSGIDDVYVHDHVLRIMPTAATGALITVSTEQGRVIRRGYEVQLKEHWNMDELEVVVFVHLGELDNQRVLQAALAKP